MKIVLNSKHSYLHESPILIQKYAEAMGKSVYFYQKISDWKVPYNEEKYKKINIDRIKMSWPGDYEMYNINYSFDDLGNEEIGINIFYDGTHIFWMFDVKRNNPYLIQAIEELNNIEPTEWVIIEIPDDVKWYVDTDEEIDGEFIREVHRIWYANGTMDWDE